ncbi:MAG: hypothetical protein ABI778_04355, partial [Ignavibacteriota bacterium]
MKPSVGISFLIFFALSGLLALPPSFAQDLSGAGRHVTYILRSLEDSVVRLPHRGGQADEFIIPGTLRVTIDSTIILRNGEDYQVDSNNRSLTLTSQLRSTFFRTASGLDIPPPKRELSVAYSVYSLDLPRVFTLYPLPHLSEQASDTLPVQALRGGQALPPPHSVGQSDDPTTASELVLTKSGGITRGIQAGNTQSLSFTNSFNFTFSGSLGEDLSFRGALSEESTPLQPEGNTQILRDVDRVYLEMIVGKIFTLTLGDYTFDLQPKRDRLIWSEAEVSSVFTNISRKVLGVGAEIAIGPTTVVAGASLAKGQFTTNTFQGIESVQGPYRLSGKNGEREIIIIAGSERVYIDGVLLRRGDLNDYVIDYGLAEITFSPRRLVTSQTRITVDFEYSNEQYNRTLLAASQATQFFNKRVEFRTSYLSEGDNPDSPLNLDLSDSDRTLLAGAGSDPLRAGRSGVVAVPKDSLGRSRGNYVRVDSLIGGGQVILYRYSPFDTVNANFNVAFGHTAAGKGAYARNGFGNFSYVGRSFGDYDTTIYLPLPERKRLFTSMLIASPVHPVVLSAEVAVSQLQPNLFAPALSVSDNAYRLHGVYQDTLGAARISARYTERFKGANFTAFDRDRVPEQLREYGIDRPLEDYLFQATSERERRASVAVGILPGDLRLEYGTYLRGAAAYQADRYSAALSLREDSLPNSGTVMISANHIHSENNIESESSVW